MRDPLVQSGSARAGARDVSRGEDRAVPAVDLPRSEVSEATLRKLAAAAQARYRTSQEMITETLRTAILRGLLPGGTVLRQDRLGTQFGVSRIPVREALRQLDAEGLVVVKPHRGAVVAELSPAEVGEIYEMRIALEQLALRLAIPHRTDADVKRAERVLAALDAVTDLERWSELNLEFHRTLYAPANRPRLFALIHSLRANVDRYARIYISVMKRKATSQQEHRRILEAYRQRDTSGALAALEEHLGRAYTELAAYLRREREGSSSRASRGRREQA